MNHDDTVGLPLTDGPFYAHTRLPTKHGTFDVRVFRDAAGAEHLAISRGHLDGGESVVVRVHSECLTSEVLGSLKCDCAAQLETALAAIARTGRGCVLYLRQEGRGIGLGNKIRAYALQEAGADTIEANRLLGLPDDDRSYDVAVEMLRGLGVRSVLLMTNNPLKLDGLAAAGMVVRGRVPCVVGLNPVNRGYLETKAARMGHLYRVAGGADEEAAPTAAPSPEWSATA
jgi:GTP cyclohydrolase II